MEYENPKINLNNEQIIEVLKSTKTIAVVGLSPDSNKDSHIVSSYMQNAGFKIVPVYPKGDIILGEKVYKNLSDIPFEIDMVNIFRKPTVITEIINEIIQSKMNIKSVWFQLGLVNNKAAQKAKEHGLKVVQNKCIKVEHKNLLF